MEANYPYGIKNPNGGRGLWMPELVLYGIRVLAKQFLETVLDIEVDQSGSQLTLSPFSISV